MHDDEYMDDIDDLLDELAERRHVRTDDRHPAPAPRRDAYPEPAPRLDGRPDDYGHPDDYARQRTQAPRTGRNDRGHHGSSKIVHIFAVLTLFIAPLAVVTVPLALRSVFRGYRGWIICLAYAVIFTPMAMITALRVLANALF